jgi:hypothetical protein
MLLVQKGAFRPGGATIKEPAGGAWVSAAPPAGKQILFVAVMMGVGLAGFGRMMMGVMAMARGGMGVVGGGVGIVFFIMPGGFAVMMRRFFMMLGSGFVMVAGGMFVIGHGLLLWDCRLSGRAVTTLPLGKSNVSGRMKCFLHSFYWSRALTRSLQLRGGDAPLMVARAGANRMARRCR